MGRGRGPHHTRAAPDLSPLRAHPLAPGAPARRDSGALRLLCARCRPSSSSERRARNAARARSRPPQREAAAGPSFVAEFAGCGCGGTYDPVAYADAGEPSSPELGHGGIWLGGKCERVATEPGTTSAAGLADAPQALHAGLTVAAGPVRGAMLADARCRRARRASATKHPLPFSVAQPRSQGRVLFDGADERRGRAAAPGGALPLDQQPAAPVHAAGDPGRDGDGMRRSGARARTRRHRGRSLRHGGFNRSSAELPLCRAAGRGPRVRAGIYSARSSTSCTTASSTLRLLPRTNKYYELA